MPPLRIALIPIARPTFDIPFAVEMLHEARQNLNAHAFDLVGPQDLIMDLETAGAVALELETADIDLCVIFQASFADSTMVTTLLEKLDALPVLWAVPEAHTGDRLRLNSFCGINLAGHALTLKGIEYEYIYASPDDHQVPEKLKVLAKAGQVKRRLKSARLGVIGEHPPGMDTCHLDAPLLERTFGVVIEQIALNDVFQRANLIPSGQVAQVRKNLDTQLPNLASLEQQPLAGTLKVYLALQALAQEYQLDALAVRCWPEFFTEMGCAACGAMSMLTEEYIPCSCEADINGTLTQLILQWLSETQAFGSDFVSIDEQRDTGILWHCGLAPISMSDPKVGARGTIHSNRRLPLIMEFPLKTGEVTIARISQARGALRLVAGRGKMVSAPAAFSGTTGALKFERSIRVILDTIMREGLEHHISITYGNVLPSLLALARILNLPVLPLN